MNSIEVIRRMHQHRQWVSHQLLTAAETLDEAGLHRAFPIGQGSVWKSLTHLYAAEFVWLEALLGNESPLTPGDAEDQLPGNQAGHGAMKSLSELRAQWNALDERWLAYLNDITQETLTEIVYKRSSLTGARAGTHRSDILIHVCTHAQYTTAQIINMMRHAGVINLPDAMLISMARREWSAKNEDTDS